MRLHREEELLHSEGLGACTPKSVARHHLRAPSVWSYGLDYRAAERSMKSEMCLYHFNVKLCFSGIANGARTAGERVIVT